jgi:hypothetical protein
MDRKEFLAKTWRGLIRPLLIIVVICLALILLWRLFNNDKLFQTADTISDILIALGTLLVINWPLVLGAIAAYCLFRFLKNTIPQKYHASIGWVIRLAIYIILFVCIVSGFIRIIERRDYDSLIVAAIIVLIGMFFSYSDRKANKKAGTRP